jgi:GNAT superfamily N-acetyltransferase
MRRKELAGHMQRAEGISVNSYLAASPALAKGAGTVTRRIAGVVCLGARNVDEPFLNRALGVGTIAEATPRLLDRIERFYAAIGRPPRIAIATGQVTGATLRLLERRGYAPLDAAQDVYTYDRSKPPEAVQVAGLEIERVGPEEAALYARVSYASFKERGPGFIAIVDALVRDARRSRRAYLGRIDSEPAATGMVFDVRPVAALGNGTVLTKFRGRGIQKAMIAHRMRDAWARGYRLFFGETENPASAHNMEALGWRKLYGETDWERKGPGGA